MNVLQLPSLTQQTCRRYDTKKSNCAVWWENYSYNCNVGSMYVKPLRNYVNRWQLYVYAHAEAI